MHRDSDSPRPAGTFVRIVGTPSGSYVGVPNRTRMGRTYHTGLRSALPMKQKLEQVFRLALAVAPLAAIALVEAAMKRW